MPTTTRLRTHRALKIGGISLSAFGTIGGIWGLIERDLFEAALGFADLLLGGIFYVHAKATGDTRGGESELTGGVSERRR